jgi:NAD(P)-dependent dehydrogenase (short-subunit alcohol dehydrogenase family)
MQMVILPVACLQSDHFYQTTGVRVMVICPGFTESEIVPDSPQESAAVTYKDEWMDEFFNELKNHKPPQR